LRWPRHLHILLQSSLNRPTWNSQNLTTSWVVIIEVLKTNSFTWSMFCHLFCRLVDVYWVTYAFEFWICSEPFLPIAIWLILYAFSRFLYYFSQFWIRGTVLSSTPLSQMEQHSLLGNKTLPVTHGVLPPYSKQATSQLTILYTLFA
jgi:hypothetical protein